MEETNESCLFPANLNTTMTAFSVFLDNSDRRLLRIFPFLNFKQRRLCSTIGTTSQRWLFKQELNIPISFEIFKFPTILSVRVVTSEFSGGECQVVVACSASKKKKIHMPQMCRSVYLNGKRSWRERESVNRFEFSLIRLIENDP